MLRPFDIYKGLNKWMRDLKEAVGFLSFLWDSSAALLSSCEWDPSLAAISVGLWCVKCLSPVPGVGSWHCLGLFQGCSAKSKVWLLVLVNMKGITFSSNWGSWIWKRFSVTVIKLATAVVYYSRHYKLRNGLKRTLMWRKFSHYWFKTSSIFTVREEKDKRTPFGPFTVWIEKKRQPIYVVQNGQIFADWSNECMQIPVKFLWDAALQITNF